MKPSELFSEDTRHSSSSRSLTTLVNSLAESREHRAEGHRPLPGSVASQAKSAADRAAQGQQPLQSNMTPQQQSAADKQANAQAMDEQIKSKLDAGLNPTEEEAR